MRMGIALPGPKSCHPFLTPVKPIHRRDSRTPHYWLSGQKTAKPHFKRQYRRDNLDGLDINALSGAEWHICYIPLQTVMVMKAIRLTKPTRPSSQAFIWTKIITNRGCTLPNKVCCWVSRGRGSLERQMTYSLLMWSPEENALFWGGASGLTVSPKELHLVQNFAHQPPKGLPGPSAAKLSFGCQHVTWNYGAMVHSPS